MIKQTGLVRKQVFSDYDIIDFFLAPGESWNYTFHEYLTLGAALPLVQTFQETGVSPCPKESQFSSP
jgi:hypothetical protein